MVTKSSACLDPPGNDAAPVSRGQRRRQEIVAVAERVFLEAGYAETTMQAVAARASASKETLYRHFGSKEDLFAEIVDNRSRRLRRSLDADLAQPMPIRDVLRELGTNLLEEMTKPEVVALMRIVVAETPRNPGLGQTFYAIGPGRMRTRLAHYLEAARARGEFRGQDTDLVSSLFLGALMSQIYMAHLILPDLQPLSAAEVAGRVDEVVALFAQRYLGALPN